MEDAANLTLSATLDTDSLAHSKTSFEDLTQSPDLTTASAKEDKLSVTDLTMYCAPVETKSMIVEMLSAAALDTTIAPRTTASDTDGMESAIDLALVAILATDSLIDPSTSAADRTIVPSDLDTSSEIPETESPTNLSADIDARTTVSEANETTSPADLKTSAILDGDSTIEPIEATAVLAEDITLATASKMELTASDTALVTPIEARLRDSEMVSTLSLTALVMSPARPWNTTSDNEAMTSETDLISVATLVTTSLTDEMALATALGM